MDDVADVQYPSLRSLNGTPKAPTQLDLELLPVFGASSKEDKAEGGEGSSDGWGHDITIDYFNTPTCPLHPNPNSGPNPVHLKSVWSEKLWLVWLATWHTPSRGYF